MKYMKMLGLLAVAAAALMAFAGTASATLTEGPGDPVDAGETLHAHSSNSALTGSVAISCKQSTVHGTITNAGGTSGTIHSLTFGECNPDTVTVVKAGTLAVSSAGVVTSTGAEVTVLTHRTIFGFPVTTHCIYRTEGTSVGTLKEGSGAELNIGSSAISQVATDGACGNDAKWTGDYKITQPAYLEVH